LDETSDQWGPWSEPQKFRTPIRDSSRLTPVFPMNTGTASAGPQTLRWANRDADVFYYEIEVSADHVFGQQGAVAPVWHNLIHGGATTPTNSWRTPDLLPNTPYFWRVRPRVQGDGVPVAWSPVWTFRT
jgi:hypothetical protein